MNVPLACRLACGMPVPGAALVVMLFATTAYAQTAPAFARAWHMGTPATVTGVLTALYQDDFENRRAELIHLIRDERSGQSFRIRFENGPPAHFRSGQRITLSGRIRESELLVLAASTDAGGTGSASAPTSTETTAVTGDQRTVVIVANFRDQSVSCSVDAINNTMFADPGGLSVDALYRDASDGGVSFSGQVVGAYTIDAGSTDACNLSGWGTAAELAASTSGVDVAAYPRKVYVMPQSTCGGAGFGTVGGPTSYAWIFSCNLKGVFAHEVGHNLGLLHASTPSSEYGDTTDPMAFGGTWLRGVNAPHREQMTWLDPASVEQVSSGGVFDIAPLAADTAAVRTIKMPKPDTNDYYYLSYRVPDGFDNYIDGVYLNKVSVHLYKGDGSPSRTYLLAGLSDGETFTDSTNGMSVMLLTHDASAARVQVDMVPTCSRRAPLMSLSPHTQSGPPAAPATYVVSLTNNDSIECAAGTFSLAAAVPAGWTGMLSSGSLTLAPGSTGSDSLVVTPPANAAAGTYSVAVQATDPASTVHTTSTSGSYVVVIPCQPNSPGVIASPAEQAGVAGSSLGYTLTITNTDTLSCPAASFSVAAEVPPGW